jgi:hypothetical protein
MEKSIAQAEVDMGVDGAVNEDPIELMDGEEMIFGSIMMQLSLNASLKKWGK